MRRSYILTAIISLTAIFGISSINYFDAFATNSTLSMTIDQTTLSLNILPHSPNGDFVKSNNSTVSVATNNYSGYTLSISASSNDSNSTNLVNVNDNTKVISSIDSAISESDFSANTTSAATNYNNKWGYLPSKFDSAINTSFRPAPGIEANAHILDSTNAPNSTANTYTIAIGARVDSDATIGAYSNTFVISAVANVINYNIAFNKGNTTDNVSDLPSNISGAVSDPLTAPTSIALPSTSPTRTDYLFKGWCTVLPIAGGSSAPDTCNGTTLQPSANYNLDLTNNPSVTLYAIWRPATYFIRYNSNGGTGSVATQTVEDGYGIVLADNAFTKTDYFFKGWATSPNATTREYRTNETIRPTDDITLYPVWGNSKTTTLYDAVASLTRGTQSSGSSGLRAAITKVNSGVYTYSTSTYGAHSDASSDYSVYYFRGILDTDLGTTDHTVGASGNSMNYPNYVKMGNTCWRIIRTTGSGGVKLFYNGTYGQTFSGSCANNVDSLYTAYGAKGSSTQSGTAWNRNINRVGYTFNNSTSIRDSTTVTSVDTVFGSNSNYSTTNTTDSNIKSYIENTWFSSANGISAYQSLLELSAGYCNDRTIYASNTDTTPATTVAPFLASGNSTYFGAYMRNEIDNKKLSLGCPRVPVDLYTMTGASDGNQQLKKPVALITADELALIGNGAGSSESSRYNAQSFAHTGGTSFTMSPSMRTPSRETDMIVLSFSGDISNASLSSDSWSFRPVVSLKPGTKAASGSGTATSPWIIAAP